MGRTKAIAHFVAVSDLSRPAQEQEGILIEIEARGGDTPSNRSKALDQLEQMWENGEIDADLFPDGIGQDNIFFVPPKSQPNAAEPAPIDASELSPVQQGAQEIIELTKHQIEVQEAAEEAAPYTPIIEAILDRNRPLTAEEKDLAKEKKYGKAIERVGSAIAAQAEYQDNCTGNGKLILNAISWQLSAKSNEEESAP